MTEPRHTCRECGARVMVTWRGTTMVLLHERDGRYSTPEHPCTPVREPAVREQGQPRATRLPFDGAQLRRARKQRCLSASQLGCLLGVSKRVYLRYESGGSWPSAVMLDRIAEEMPDALPAQPRRERVDDREQAER